MRRLVQVLALAGVTSLAGCPAIELVPTSVGTTNSCTTDAACATRFGAGAVCDTGACVNPSPAQRPIFVVTLATTATFAAGYTFGFTPKEIGIRPQGCNVAKNLECNLMPRIADTLGAVDVSPGLMKTISPPKGLLPSAPDPFFSNVSLPVKLRFQPMWVDPATNVALDARSLGLPLPPTTSDYQQINAPPAPTNGPEPGFGIGFRASVPLVDGVEANARFLVEVDPVPPYESYPPIVQSLLVGGGPINYHLVTLSAPQSTIVYATPLKIVAAGAPPRDYRVYVSRIADGVRVSSIKVLEAVASQDIVLYSSLQSFAGCELVLEPPDGSEGLPTQRIADNGGFSPGIFPAMPPLVAISGRVSLQGDLGVPVDAEIVFESKAGLVDVDGKSPVASYRRRVRTRADAGHAGEYSVNLLPGSYKVYAIPLSGSLSAITTKSIVVSSPQVGAGISIVLRHALRGRVSLPDGTPADNVVVEAKANPEYYASLVDAPPVLPRDARATTDASGKFELLVDDGEFDLTVRPNPATRLPYVISTQHVVHDDVTLASDILIPAPTARRGILLDGVGNSVVRTLIRAYAFPDKATSKPGETRPARLVGETYTDGAGRYELFLGPLPN